MRLPAIAAVVVTMAIAGTSAPAIAQGNPHLGHVAERWRDTPDNVGFLSAAKMEAEIAAQHAALAVGDLENLASIKRHTGHVVHALNPDIHPSGPGKGYGLVKAIGGVATHIKLAADTDGASDNVKRHAAHVAASAGNVERWSLAVIEHAEMIMTTEDASVAAEHARQINDMMQQIINGHDANGDGRIGWQEGEGGMAQAEQHMNLLLQGEGTSR